MSRGYSAWAATSLVEALRWVLCDPASLALQEDGSLVAGAEKTAVEGGRSWAGPAAWGREEGAGKREVRVTVVGLLKAKCFPSPFG